MRVAEDSICLNGLFEYKKLWSDDQDRLHHESHTQVGRRSFIANGRHSEGSFDVGQARRLTSFDFGKSNSRRKCGDEVVCFGSRVHFFCKIRD